LGAERSVRRVKQRLLAEGAKMLDGGKGSHTKFFHKGKMIVFPRGKNGELPTGTAESIAKRAGWKQPPYSQLGKE
jgi:predicted RNA binding protein YcfA (HicA-like mRNA interferase family)